MYVICFFCLNYTCNMEYSNPFSETKSCSNKELSALYILYKLNFNHANNYKTTTNMQHLSLNMTVLGS